MEKNNPTHGNPLTKETNRMKEDTRMKEMNQMKETNATEGSKPGHTHTFLKTHLRMKRSNLLLIYLIAALLLTPLLVYAMYVLFPGKGDLSGYGQRCTTIKVDHPAWAAGHVKVFPQTGKARRIDFSTVPTHTCNL